VKNLTATKPMHAASGEDNDAPSWPPRVFLTEEDLAARWQVSIRVLQKWRGKGGGPRFHKFGAAVRYAMSDIENFESRAVRVHTSE
jgi:hypothetical protein